MPWILPSDPRILIVRFSSLGDVALATAVLPALRRAYPGARLSFVTKRAYAEIPSLSGDLDEVIALSPGESLFSLARRLKSARPDLVLDLHGSLRSLLLRLLLPGVAWKGSPGRRWKRLSLVWLKWSAGPRRSVLDRYEETLRSLGLAPDPLRPRLRSDPASLPRPERDRLDSLPRPLVGFCLGARHATKRWGFSRALRAAESLQRRTGGGIVFIGAEKLAGRLPAGFPSIDLTGRTSLKALAAAISKLSVLVTVDSGPMHIAEALGVPVIALFGPTVPAFGFAPHLERSRIVEAPLPCRPCSLHGGRRCPLTHHRCMEEILPEAVARQALGALGTER